MFFVIVLTLHKCERVLFVNILLRSHVDGAADAERLMWWWQRRRSSSAAVVLQSAQGWTSYRSCVALDPAVRWNLNMKQTSPTAVIWTLRSSEGCFLLNNVAVSDKWGGVYDLTRYVAYCQRHLANSWKLCPFGGTRAESDDVVLRFTILLCCYNVIRCK